MKCNFVLAQRAWTGQLFPRCNQEDRQAMWINLQNLSSEVGMTTHHCGNCRSNSNERQWNLNHVSVPNDLNLLLSVNLTFDEVFQTNDTFNSTVSF